MKEQSLILHIIRGSDPIRDAKCHGEHSGRGEHPGEDDIGEEDALTAEQPLAEGRDDKLANPGPCHSYTCSQAHFL